MRLRQAKTNPPFLTEHIFAQQLRKHSTDENERDWRLLKEELDRLGEREFKKRPARYIAKWGCRLPAHPYAHRYVDLLFADAIGSSNISARYGHRRALALVGLFALEQGFDREAGRAMLLLSHHSELKKRIANRSNATKPRGRQKNKPTDRAIKNALTSFLAIPSHSRRNAVTHLVKFFAKLGKQASDHWVRNRIKKLGI